MQPFISKVHKGTNANKIYAAHFFNPKNQLPDTDWSSDFAYLYNETHFVMTSLIPLCIENVFGKFSRSLGGVFGGAYTLK